MIHAKFNSWLYYRALDLPGYKYAYHYPWLGNMIVVFVNRRLGEKSA